MTLKEMAERLGLKGPGSLRVQIRNGALIGEKVGTGPHAVWLVSEDEFARYEQERHGKGNRGFARPDHPLHGKQGPGHRRKGASPPDTPETP